MAKRGLNGTASIESTQEQELPSPPAPIDWIEWAQRHQAKIVFFRRINEPRVRVSLEGNISYEGSTLDEACRECVKRLERLGQRAPRALRVYRG